MSRQFVRASSQHLRADEAPLTAPPMLLTSWAKATGTASTTRNIINIGDKDVSTHYQGLAEFTDDTYAVSRGGGSQQVANQGNFTAGAWRHAAALILGAASRYAYHGTIRSTQGTGSATMSGADRIAIGTRVSLIDFYDGLLAYCCVWDLSGVASGDRLATADAIVADLTAGAHPLQVVLDHEATGVVLRRLYLDEHDDLDDHSGQGGASLTNVGTTVSADNPAVDPPPSAGEIPLTLTATVGASASMFRRTSKGILVPVSIGPSITKRAGRTLTAQASAAGAVSPTRVLVLALQAAVSASASIVKRVGKALRADVGAGALIRRQVGLGLTAQVAATGDLGSLKGRLLTLVANVGASASLTKKAAKSFLASVTGAASMRRRPAKVLTAQASATAGLVKRARLVLSAHVGAAGSIVKRIGKVLVASPTCDAILLLNGQLPLPPPTGRFRRGAFRSGSASTSGSFGSADEGRDDVGSFTGGGSR